MVKMKGTSRTPARQQIDLDFVQRLLRFASGDWLDALPSTKALPNDVRRAMPHLLTAVVARAAAGVPLSAREACDALHIERARTGPRYIGAAEKAGLLAVGPDPRGDKRKAVLKPTPLLEDLFAKEVGDLKAPAMRGPGKGHEAYNTEGRDRPSRATPAVGARRFGGPPAARIVRVMRSRYSARFYAERAAEFVELLCTADHDRVGLLNELRASIGLSAEVVQAGGVSRLASFGEEWGIAAGLPSGTEISSAVRKFLSACGPTTKIVPGSHHREFPDQPHPADLQTSIVLANMVCSLRPQPVKFVDGLFILNNLEGTLILVGGVSSNALTRLIRQYRRAPAGGFAPIPNPMIPRPFILEAHRDDARVAIAGKYREPRWGVRDTICNEWFYPELDESSRPQTDYLTVTVVPNFLDQASYERGNKIIIFAGLYGPGSMASILLLQHSTLWAAIEKRLNGAKWWQAMFQIDKVDHSGAQPVPKSINANEDAWRCYSLDVPDDLYQVFLNFRAARD